MLENSLKPNSPSEPDSSPLESAGVRDERGGRIRHDSRGNAVWDWGVATGVFAGIKSTELLSMLDNPTLALEGECPMNVASDWAGDPYNRR